MRKILLVSSFVALFYLVSFGQEELGRSRNFILDIIDIQKNYGAVVTEDSWNKLVVDHHKIGSTGQSTTSDAFNIIYHFNADLKCILVIKELKYRVYDKTIREFDNKYVRDGKNSWIGRVNGNILMQIEVMLKDHSFAVAFMGPDDL